MSRYFELRTPQAKQSAILAIQSVPLDQNLAVRIVKKNRTLEQNSLLWALLTEVSEQVVWHGRKLTPENWKDMFSASLKKMDVVPNLDGDGFVILGQSTSRMTVSQLNDLIALIQVFGAENGVVFKDQVRGYE